MASLTIGGVQHCNGTPGTERTSYFWPSVGAPGTKGAFIGEDIPIPGLAGQLDGDRIYDHLDLELEGWIHGVGATLALRQASYQATLETLSAKWDGSLGAQAVALLLPDGRTATAHAKFVLVQEHGLTLAYFQRFTLQLISVESPPWVIA